MFYSLPEILLIAAAAIVMDWIIGDPKWPTHPVIWIGRFVPECSRSAYGLKETAKSAKELRRIGSYSDSDNGTAFICSTVRGKRSGCTYSPMAGLCGIRLVYLDNDSCKRA